MYAPQSGAKPKGAAMCSMGLERIISCCRLGKRLTQTSTVNN